MPNRIRRILMLYTSGTRGGPQRLEILSILSKKPENTNVIAGKLGIDYKTAQHHMRVLEKAGFVSPAGKKYGNEYTLSPLVPKSLVREISRRSRGSA